MTGLELMALVRERRPAAAFYLVGEVYSAQDEVAARLAGATVYACKPPARSWLLNWRRSVGVAKTAAGSPQKSTAGKQLSSHQAHAVTEQPPADQRPSVAGDRGYPKSSRTATRRR